MIEFTIPGAAMGKQRPRVMKNGITFTPAKTVNYEIFIKEIYMINKLPVIVGAIKAEILIIYGITKSTSKKDRLLMLSDILKPCKKPDIDNIMKIIFDALNGIAYKDDSQIVQVSCRKMYGDEPKVIVNFTEFGGKE